VVLLDLEMPGTDGVATIPLLIQAVPGSHILVFTAYDTDEHVFGALRAGARGYLLKGAAAEEIARAVRTMHAGGSHLEPRVAARLVAEVGAPRPTSGGLSGREREVLGLAAGGLSNKQIARSLGITERTVKFHVTSIFNKLGAENRAQAVAMAIQQGLVKL
jgi:DNA-binding NarL/FixJ family response regulator